MQSNIIHQIDLNTKHLKNKWRDNEGMLKWSVKKANLNRCYFIEVLGIRNTKTSHSMLMSPFLEMPLISSPAPITMVPTNLTFELLKTFTTKSWESWHHQNKYQIINSHLKTEQQRQEYANTILNQNWLIIQSFW